MLSAAVFQAIMNVTALVELLLPLLARVLQSHHHHQQSMGLASSQPELEGEAPGQDYREGGHTQYCLASPSTQFYIYIYLYCIYLYNIDTSLPCVTKNQLEKLEAAKAA